MSERRLRLSRLTKPVAAVMAADRGLIAQAVDWLAAALGGVELASEPFAFDFTDYYRREMGPGLVKQFFCFGHLLPPEHLAGLKRRCAAYERANRRPRGGRTVNIDPGYWSDAKLVLASTKNFAHRIPIGRRVFAEVTLRYYKGRLGGLEWTYPDYLSGPALDFFGKVRRLYLEQIAKP
ncbi:MAG: DUF4416 family protein [Candidatus Glassbacteria bacterium]|nr:DUF4416 family protein [Candidatus Glassbacteria bacterium]